MITTEYAVTGMTCGHCASAITEEVGALAEVLDVTVDHSSGRMVVSSASPVSLDAITAAVDEAGDYSVAPRDADNETGGH